MDGLQRYDSFATMPAETLAVFERAAQSADFFLSPAWLRYLAQSTLAQQGRLRLYCLYRDGAPRILLPLMQQEQARAGRRLASPSNYYSALAGPLMVAPAIDGHALGGMIAAIAAERPRWDRIDLRPLAPEAVCFQQLQRGLDDSGLAVQPYFCFGNWYLDVAGRSYAQYHAGLPSRLRNTLARKIPQLRASGQVELEIVQDGAALERAIADYQSVYLASWKKPEPYPDFMPGLIRLCAELGKLRLGVVRIDGQPVAAQVWIVHHGVAAIYKLAYDARVAALSVGSVLTAALMEHVIDIDRVHQVDYLMGDDRYKQDWMSHRRERWGLMAFNLSTLDGLSGYARHVGGRLFRRLERGLPEGLRSGNTFQFWRGFAGRK